mgnify:CR=1 FL=1
MTPVLSVRGLQKRFGAVVAADNISIDIPPGQKLCLIGANGALTGYAGGLARKAWLLAHEGAR